MELKAMGGRSFEALPLATTVSKPANREKGQKTLAPFRLMGSIALDETSWLLFQSLC